MPEFVSKSPTLVTQICGASVGFRFYSTLRRSCGTLLVGTALLLLVRRLEGAFDRPPSFGTALIAILAATLLAAVYRASLRCSGLSLVGPRDRDTTLPIRLQRLSALEEFVVEYLPTGALLVIAASLTLPGIGTAALGAIWLTVVAGEAAWFGSRFAPDGDPPRPKHDVGLERTAAAVVDLPADANVPAAEAECDDAEHVSQSWTRSRDVEGREIVEGFVRVRFESGSRQAAIHLSFCPPFERTPTLEAEPIDEVDLTLTTVVALPYAARIDAKLAEPAEEEFQLKVAIRAVAEPTPQSGSGDEPNEL